VKRALFRFRSVEDIRGVPKLPMGFIVEDLYEVSEDGQKVLKLRFDQPPEGHSFALATSADVEIPVASTSTSQPHEELEVISKTFQPSIVGADET